MCLCISVSAMDALQWMGAVRMRADKNITIIHTTPVHQLTSGEDKSWNKSSIKIHSDGTHSLQSIHCWDTDAETHFYKPDEETNSVWMEGPLITEHCSCKPGQSCCGERVRVSRSVWFPLREGLRSGTYHDERGERAGAGQTAGREPLLRTINNITSTSRSLTASINTLHYTNTRYH